MITFAFLKSCLIPQCLQPQIAGLFPTNKCNLILIALRPAEPRDSARLLVVQGDALKDSIVSDLPKFLRAGDCLVLNDTKVIPAQLDGLRERPGAPGAEVGFTLHMRSGPNSWRAFAKIIWGNLRKQILISAIGK